MALAEIPNPEPITVEVVPQKIFNKLFCTELEVISYPEAEGKPWVARFTGAPCDGAEVLRSKSVEVELIDIKNLAAQDPALAQALAAVLGVIGTYLVKCSMKKKFVVTTSNVEEILR